MVVAKLKKKKRYSKEYKKKFPDRTVRKDMQKSLTRHKDKLSPLKYWKKHKQNLVIKILGLKKEVTKTTNVGELVGQLCTNPKSDRSLLSCLKVTQCSTDEFGDAPLYNSCSLLIQLMTTGPLLAPSKCKSGLQRITGTCPGWWKKVSGYGYGLLCGFKWGPHHATSHLRSRLESQHQSVPGCAEECGNPLVQSGGRWQTLGVAAGLGTGPQVQRDPGLASGVLRLCTPLSLASSPRPEPVGLLRLVIRREHHQYDLPHHQSQPDRRHTPSIHRAPAGACGKGMLPVPDSFRGGDWGWRRLHWIDVSSTT